MKILYAASLSPNDSALYRQWALERLGHEIVPLNFLPYMPQNPLLHRIVYRAVLGPHVDRFNRDVIELAERERPDVLWADKLLWMRPRTLDRLRGMGITLVSYMIDNPFGPRQDPGWRVYMKSIPHYDLHVVQRDKNIADYRSRGARDVIKIQTAYEPTIHFPPPEGWSDRDRDREVSFVGTPYDDRADTLARLSNEFGVTISGNGRQWRRALGPEAFSKLYREGELYRQQYREAIWRSKINLSFITHSNQDEFVHKSFEIAACGGFLLAERSQGHMDRFVEGEEAIFFTGFDELAEKIRRYLPDEEARARIATAGQRRAQQDGYHNDRQVELIVERVESIMHSARS
ncbi:CgeB family protein [Edaphobacter albus]|uniref:CgeB family protein n=1 Tax=Edaphobacter sp. 4G125 TaxID=2763071 RepID=UPI00164717D8|nr:glycosyltransferase [Edaphobacter sp. 4G125]QNI35394.1 glycosyltransferase [Edaphobacter sp. 4G125]